eukprot:CAMPEP_0184499486 /NCGR_PEP_ID=MMETSP0113_2-20130426/41614_1 /TAXON_ID=91329 /ORGANISM="Norrisiella sphaerica, Strain BC52" /LENGTH=330 /DNA_ID=CAMNT_0026887405 /DNA_START=189 /DNA_END=1178 /DNA_ORIENTATION=-
MKKTDWQNLTTRERRLYGLPSDPRSALADTLTQKSQLDREGKKAPINLSPNPTSPSELFSPVTTARSFGGRSSAAKYSSGRLRYGKSPAYISPISVARLEALEDTESDISAGFLYFDSQYDTPSFAADLGESNFKFDPNLIGSVPEYRTTQPPAYSATRSVPSRLPKKMSPHDRSEFSLKATKFLRDLRITGDEMSMWTQNLKYWMVRTILKPKLKEFAESDRKFKSMADRYSKERLTNEQRALVLDPDKFREFVMSRSPGDRLVRERKRLDKYLECGNSSKKYVLGRLKKFGRSLSNGANYSGDRGGGREWKAGMPTDAKLVMHVFLTW